MTSRWLTIIYLGLTTRHVGAATCTYDVQEKCSQNCQENMKPVISFFEALLRSSEGTSDESSRIGCRRFSDSQQCKNGSCYCEKLLRTFELTADARLYITVTANDVKKDVINEICCSRCSCPVTSKPKGCTPCTTQYDTTTTTHKMSKGTDQDRDTSTTIAASPQPNVSNEPSQDSHIIVIVGVLSFLGGVLITFLSMCAYIRICKRYKPGSTGKDDAGLQPEMHTERESNLHVNQKTYESLARKECTGTDQLPPDQVYLGLDTNLELNQMSDTKMDREDGRQTNTNREPDMYRKDDAAVTEYHVYNVLKSEDTSNVYEDTKAKEMTEHTYSGLGTRDNTNQSMNPDPRIPELQNDQPGEDHDYFLLENDVTRQTTDKGTVDTHQIECQVTETKEDDHFAIGHDYFTLEKGENSGPSIHESGENVRVSETESFHDGHDYFKLEKV